MNPSFYIEKIVPSSVLEQIDVHVRYDGGSTVFTFPKTYPKGTILAQVRLEIRSLIADMDVKARLASLVGRHDL